MARTGPPGPAPPPGARGTGWFLAAYAGAAGFLGLEAIVGEGGDAASLAASPDDQGTTRLVIVASLALPLLAPLARRFPLGTLPGAAGPVGLATEAAGLGLRTWAMGTLGAAYSRTLRTTWDHRVVDRGPYRLVRHPGYLGSLLLWTGFALAARRLPLLAAVVVPAYRRRILAEERLLRRDLPGYPDYAG
ncbi:MAG TPA: isoprenylcysteine carboxylmethyltransferase family protein, partial [Acidimicrobiales bacterium]|nr:isoprenylcysteine carboxylmethyltransferase family protein [Acidimicrobiales bacterium]